MESRSGFHGLRGLRSFDDHGEYVRNRDRDREIDNNGLCAFVGNSDLFYNF